ncbi:MAG: hypothetical protein U0133_18655 [Gemmatimonadales bacterium]
MTADYSLLESQVVAVLRQAGRVTRTAEVITACPGWPGWQVRRCLDRLAADSRVCWRRGKNNPTARLWCLNPSPSKAAS